MISYKRTRGETKSNQVENWTELDWTGQLRYYMILYPLQVEYLFRLQGVLVVEDSRHRGYLRPNPRDDRDCHEGNGPQQRHRRFGGLGCRFSGLVFVPTRW